MTPRWAVSCTCGAVPPDYYCADCRAFASHPITDVAPHNTPRAAAERQEQEVKPEAKPERPAPRSMTLRH